ncbi:MAG: prepilin-type N-terminal cleavage/methylation domain-containing protein [Magnetococcus sp. MYC-9]
MTDHARREAGPVGGFSLLELLMVLMLIGIVLLFAAPQWPEPLLLEAQAQRLAQDIRYTQALTMNRDQRHTIFRLAANRYTIVDANGTPIVPEPAPLEGVSVEPFSFSFTPPMAAPAGSYPPVRLTLGGEALTLAVTDWTGTVLLQP